MKFSPSINIELENLYSNHYTKALEAYKNQSDFKMSNPLLLKVDEDNYWDSDIKVMILGQETYGWFGKTQKEEDIEKLKNNDWLFIEEFENIESTAEFGNVSIQQLMYEYDKYLRYDIRGKKKSTFWNGGFNFFKDKLEKYYHDKKLYFIWNNVSKLGRIDDTGVSKEIKEFEKEHFHLLKEEFEILKPDIVIFLTGTNRDDDIRDNFQDAEFSLCGYPQFTEKVSNPLIVKSASLPAKTIRLYHPNYFGGYTKIKNVALDMIVKDCDKKTNKEEVEDRFWETLALQIKEILQVEIKRDFHTLSFEFNENEITIKREWNLYIKINKNWSYITLGGIKNCRIEKADDLINMELGNDNFWQLTDEDITNKLIGTLIDQIKNKIET